MHLAHEVFAGIYGEDIDENFIFHMRSSLAYASDMYYLIADTLMIRPTTQDNVEFAMLKANPKSLF